MQSFSSPGDVARTNKNAADSAYRPHPVTGDVTYDRDQSDVELAIALVSAPTCERGFDYSNTSDPD